jgi:uncharacterized protein YndB with AHSA1/START domain
MAEPPRSLTLTRVFDASPERVFAAWTDPQQLGRWMGPRAVVRCEVPMLDLRPGGAYRIIMHTEGGEVHTVGGLYREIVRPGRLVFTWAWEGEGECAPMQGSATLITLTFRAVGKKTEMALLHEGFLTDTARNNHEHGWTGSFGKLAEALDSGAGA